MALYGYSPTSANTNTYTFNQGSAIYTLVAQTENPSGNTFSSAPSLPIGLSLNGTSGAITGTPTAISAATNYVITCNSTSNYTINITVLANMLPVTYQIQTIPVPAIPGVTYNSYPNLLFDGIIVSNNDTSSKYQWWPCRYCGGYYCFSRHGYFTRLSG